MKTWVINASKSLFLKGFSGKSKTMRNYAKDFGHLGENGYLCIGKVHIISLYELTQKQIDKYDKH